MDEKTSHRERNILILVVALSLALIASCFALPYILTSDDTSSSNASSDERSQDVDQETSGLEEILIESDSYSEAQDIVEENYVNNVDGDDLLKAGARGIRRMANEGYPEEDLVERGIVAMIDSLDDPFSSYMDRDELEMLDTQLSGSFSGIGVRMQQVKNEIRIIEVLEGTPAEAAGLKDGDIVKEVDGRDVSDLDINEVVMFIRGPEGTTVNLGIMRAPDPDLVYFDIVRGEIEIPVLEYELMEGDIGYMRLTDWTEDVDEKISEALRDLEGQGAKGLIIDLRSNPGGYMEPAIRAADLFLRDGMIVSSKGRIAGATSEYTADANVEWDLPVVLLVDRGSASSSEIFAAALLDNDRAVLVGETTFGKGSIQKLYRQEDGTAVRLTIAKYYTPDGASIDDEGIEPDYLVKNPVVGEEDLQLQKAIEILSTEI
jgi:carboxyl-terminal processing protease